MTAATCALGDFGWVGLATSDPADAKAFYARLLGWQSEDLPAGELGTYTILRHDGGVVAILYRQTREARAARAAPHWTPNLSVEDADASALRAKELGGALLRDPHDLPGAGRVAAVRDPAGGIVSLWQPSGRSGRELLADVDVLRWHDLITTEGDRAKSFYGELLGWHYETDASGSTTVINAGSPIATIREPREREGAGSSCWIPYFPVENTQRVQFEVEATGGYVLSAPFDGPTGRSAVFADPQGASFGLLEAARAA
ncbi:MAG TPA: VOC family protein [Gaiellaceae bacterium]|nr:VOC family protein [Gaiellaceae bacterium]